jgi:hypothetical protein
LVFQPNWLGAQPSSDIPANLLLHEELLYRRRLFVWAHSPHNIAKREAAAMGATARECAIKIFRPFVMASTRDRTGVPYFLDHGGAQEKGRASMRGPYFV